MPSGGAMKRIVLAGLLAAVAGLSAGCSGGCGDSGGGGGLFGGDTTQPTTGTGSSLPVACPTGQHREGSLCVPDAAPCLPPAILDNGRCTCMPPNVVQNGACVTPQSP